MSVPNFHREGQTSVLDPLSSYTLGLVRRVTLGRGNGDGLGEIEMSRKNGASGCSTDPTLSVT